jgi:hypothetical protein
MAKTGRELAETVTESVKTAATKLTGGPKKRVSARADRRNDTRDDSGG